MGARADITRAWNLGPARRRRPSSLPSGPISGPPPGPPSGSPDLKELEAITGALNKSAERVQTLWFSFLSVSLYFALAAGTTTHRMLFLEEGLSLPLVDVKLPLLGFYAIGPAFYVAFHAYFLMMLVLLARTAKTFVTTLDAALPEADRPVEHERFRMRIENALFLQIIIGARREREGANGRVLRGLALVSIAVVPVLLLLAFQLMFLPYHSELMTWWHRGLVMLDLLLVWTLWPSYRRHWGERMAPDWWVWVRDTAGLVRWRGGFPALRGEVAPFPRWQLVNAGLSTVVLVFSLAMATFPDERVHGNRVAAAIDEVGQRLVVLAGYRLPEKSDRFPKILSDAEKKRTVGYDSGRLSAWLFGWEMPIQEVTADKRGLFPNRLWLPDEDFVDDETLKRLLADNTKGDKGETKRVAYAVDLRNRDLTGAVLVRADLQSADLKEARIARATLSDAWLQNARLDVVDGGGARLDEAQMQGASLVKAQLQGASLDSAQLKGASLDSAQLQGASLRQVQLQSNKVSSLQLQGASLILAQLQGASLDGAQFQGASLDGAQFQGASLYNSELLGASLYASDLQGALLVETQFQGASLRDTQLKGVSLDNIQVWRASGEPKNTTLMTLGLVGHETKPVAANRGPPNDFGAWLRATTENIPPGYARKLAIQRLTVLSPAAESPEDEIPFDFWKKAEQNSAEAEPQEYADFLVDLACVGGDGAPYVARGLLENGRLKEARSFLPGVAVRLSRSRPGTKHYDPAACPGTAGFTNADWSKLDVLVRNVGNTRTVPEAESDLPPIDTIIPSGILMTNILLMELLESSHLP